jgi:hypothetical protein
VYRNTLKHAQKELQAYYPGRQIIDYDTEVKLTENNWTVFSCHINDLEKNLKSLSPGQKQLALTRWQDQVTVVVNNLDFF